MPPEAPAGAVVAAGPESGSPALPKDGVQPWEELDGQGLVQPAGRSATSVTAGTIFTPGVERFLSAGDAKPNGEALRLNSVSSNDTSYAIYRISLQDQQPGIVSIDANLLSAKASYYVGVSNYGGVRWEWNGPFTDGRIRLPVLTDGNGDYTSELGNTFVTVLAEAGNTLDIVGVGVNQYDPADAARPATPGGLALTAVNGGLELSWSAVPASDIAGYQVYYSAQPFSNPHSAGVKRLRQLEGGLRCILGGLEARTYVALTSWDFGGNESDPTAVLNALPLAGDPAALMLTTDIVSGKLNQAASLSASGAALYDWDLDGDGVFEVTADSSGSQQAYTGATGVIRPAVRGSDVPGEAVALGSVSLLIIGNNRPVASALADPQSGPAPLSVQFTGTAEDMEDDLSALGFAWDFNGDGIYEDGTDLLQPPATDYTINGTWNARFRVTDSEGAWDVDSVAISVGEGQGGWPTAALSADKERQGPNVLFGFNAASSSDPDGVILDYEWDIDNDNLFNEGNGESASRGRTLLHMSWDTPGEYLVSVRVTDDDGHKATASASVRVAGWLITNLDTPVSPVSDTSLFIVQGHPAIAYYDNDTDDLYYVRAQDSQGTAWNTSKLVDVDSYVRGPRTALVVNGNPAIAYSGSGAPGLRFSRATDAVGDSWGARQELDNTAGTTSSISMLMVQGRAAIAYSSSATSSLRYIRAVDADASSWGSFVTPDSSDSPGLFNSMEIVNGRPAISYLINSGGDLGYVHASTADGSAWDSPQVVITTGTTGYETSLQVVDGAPAIAFRNQTTPEQLFVRALDPDGDDWGSPVQLQTGVGRGNHSSMVIHGGRPLIFCSNSFSNQMVQISAADSAGTIWSQPFRVDEGAGQSLSRPSAIVFGDQVAVSYYDSAGDDLRFALMY